MFIETKTYKCDQCFKERKPDKYRKYAGNPPLGWIRTECWTTGQAGDEEHKKEFCSDECLAKYAATNSFSR